MSYRLDLASLSPLEKIGLAFLALAIVGALAAHGQESAMVAPFIERPTPSLTPGELAADPVAVVCSAGYAKAHRHTPASLKRGVLRSYGVSWEARDRFEVDHLFPLCAGGADTAGNLWPESREVPPGSDGWTAGDKDRLERCVCRLICSGRVTQFRAFVLISGDWTNAYTTFIPMCRGVR